MATSKKSTRSEDSKKEQEMGKYLEKYFYPNTFPEHQRISDKSEQLLGIDVKVKDGNKFVSLDEKGMLSNDLICKDIPTFACECSFINKTGHRVDGWLIKSNNLTDAYLFVWIKDMDNKEDFKMENIKKVEVMLVDKQELKDFLESNGLTDEQIKADVESITNKHGWKSYLSKKDINEIANTPSCDKFPKRSSFIDNKKCLLPMIKYSFSLGKLAEEPINLVIRKEIYKSLPSTRDWTVTPDFLKENDLGHKPIKYTDIGKTNPMPEKTKEVLFRD